MLRQNKTAFTLIEILVVISIIAVLATGIYLALGGTRTNAADKLRQAELNRLGQYLKAAGGSFSSLASGLPLNGDLNILFDAIESQTGQQIFGQRPRDPNAPAGQSGFGYIIAGDKIVIYANLANGNEKVTLPYSEPTPGGGDGVLQGTGNWSSGLNHTDKYYQVTN